MSKYFLIFLFLVSYLDDAYATHIRGGEILASSQPESGLTYKIRIIIYTDDHSPVPASNGTINFGDGTGDFSVLDILDTFESEPLEDDLTKQIITVIHSFPTTGSFLISFREFNRDLNARNLLNSINTPFYLESQLVIDPFLGPNKPPELNIPLFKATVGTRYLENPMAVDNEGDSLSYRIVVNKQDRDVPVIDYLYPNDPLLYEGVDYNVANENGDGPPTYSIDAETGDLVWDAPGTPGSYVVAYTIEEWRRIGGVWYSLGFIYRDFQIQVKDIKNNRPYLILPVDTLIRAGELLTAVIIGRDPDGDEITIESSGAPYNFATLPAEFEQQGPAGIFSWQTDPEHISDQPYEVDFRIYDHPHMEPVLYNYGTWRITVSDLTPQKEIYQNDPVKIYPNPTTGLITIENNFNEAGPAQLFVFDHLGRLVITEIIQSPLPSFQVNLKGNSKGIYFIRLNSLNKSIVKKLLLVE